MLADLLKNNWNSLFFEYPELHLDNVLWDSWFDGTSDVTVRFKEPVTNVFSGEVPDEDIICDPFGTTVHFKSIVDIHIFVRDSTLTEQIDVIPKEIDIMLRYIDDWIADRPLILNNEGISKIIVTEAKSDIPFDDELVTHSLITTQLSYTKMYR